MTPELDEVLVVGAELGWDRELELEVSEPEVVEVSEPEELEVSELAVPGLPVLELVVVMAGVVVVVVLEVE